MSAVGFIGLGTQRRRRRGVLDVVLSSITGVINNPTLGLTAQIGTELTGVLNGLQGREVIAHRWRDNGGLVSGATSATYTPVAGQNLQNLRYAPLVDGMEISSAPYIVRHAPPTLNTAATLSGNAVEGGNLNGVPAAFIGGDVSVANVWQVSADGATNWADTGDTDTESPTLVLGLHYRFVSVGENSGGLLASVSAANGPVVAVAITVAGGGVAPAAQRAYQGQLFSATPDHASISSIGNYQSNAGAVTSVVFQTQDGGSGPWTTRAGTYALEQDQERRVVVTDDQGNTRIWQFDNPVEYALQIADGPGNTLEIDRNDIVTTGVYDIDLTVADPPINETVQLDIADLVAGAVMLAVPAPTGTAAVGEELSVQEGIAATEDAGGITGRNYLWGRFLTASETLEDAVPISGATAATYTVQAADQGYTIVCEQTAVDAGGTGTAAISPTGVEIPAAVGAVTNTFTAPDNTALQTHTPEDGFPFLPAVYSPDPSPMEILGGAVRPTQAGDSSAHVQTGRAPVPNSRITANIRMYGVPNNTHSQGVTLWDSANGVRYTFRFNGNERRWQLYRFGGLGNILIFGGEPGGSTAVDGTFTDGVTRQIILEKNGDFVTGRIDGNLIGTHDITAVPDGFVSGQPGLQSFNATANGARVNSMLFEVL